MDVRCFTVGQVAENCYIAPPRRRRPRADRRPRRGGRADPRARSTSSGSGSTRSCSPTCHFDHIGAVAPVAKATGAPGLLPRDRGAGARRHHVLRPLARVRPVRELRRRRDGRGRRAARARRVRDRRASSRRATAPATSPTRSATSAALFSGDVLFQGSVGRVDLPGGDWPTLLESIRDAGRGLSRRRRPSIRATWGSRRSAPSARPNPFLAELAR